MVDLPPPDPLTQEPKVRAWYQARDGGWIHWMTLELDVTQRARLTETERTIYETELTKAAKR